MNYTGIDGSAGLATLDAEGRVPETRMATASDAAQRVQILFYAEQQGRSQRRALVKGLVDGNPPYRPADLRKAGRAQACNVNWRVPEFYLNMGRFAFYEVFSETPTYCTVETAVGNGEQNKAWSGIITEEFDTLLRSDTSWDRIMQFSIYDMVLYGFGPLVFRDEFDWRNDFIPSSGLIVPDFSPSNPDEWDECVIACNYTPTELYGFIRNEDKAKELGWNVEITKQAIMQAHTFWQQQVRYNSWEWHQQQLKNNSFWYNSTARVIQVCHYYFKEFPLPGQPEGRITHTIIINPEDNQVVTQQGSQAFQRDYLYQNIGRYERWGQIVHPMYYDNDGGGYHHSVTGLGVKMYSAMEYQNRLMCNIADKAFAPKILFKPLTGADDQAMNIVQYAEFGKVPAGYDVVQTPVQSFMEEGMSLHREITGLVSGNLAQYRTSLSKESGNPITAYEAQLRSSEQSRLGRTQLNHFYNQLDWLYEEKYHRVVDERLNGFMPGGQEAVLFRHRCFARGVPPLALTKIRGVKATRTVGQGSPFQRQQALQTVLAIATMLPEGGRMNAVDDFIAAVAGQSMVERYSPKQQTPEEVDQLAQATLQLAAAKQGVPPIVGGSQNHYIYARTFLQAVVSSIQSIGQGANPMEVIAFNQTVGPTLIAHIQALEQDPSHQAEAKEMMKMAMQVEQQVKQMISTLQQKQAQQQKEARKMQAEAARRGPAMNLEQQEAAHKMRLEQARTQNDIQTKQRETQQSLAIADAQSASEITRANRESEARISREKAESVAKMAIERQKAEAAAKEKDEKG